MENGLWVSDGSASATRMVRSLFDPAGYGGAYGLVLGGSRLLIATNGVVNPCVWTSDGTEAGTFLFKDLCPGLCSGYPMRLASDGKRLYFSATDGLHGHELWVSDGTPEGTALAADIKSGPGSSAPEQITPSGATLYFTADDGRIGRELWRYDLSEACR